MGYLRKPRRSDSKQPTGSRDGERINVNLAYELREWARKFAVTPEELKAAVKAVGDNARKVEEYLNGIRQGSKKRRPT
jgi:hypothetical protein